jgi:hypothetical protein
MIPDYPIVIHVDDDQGGAEMVSRREYDKLREETQKLQLALLAAARAMHNDFEPDNQSKAYNDAINAVTK